MADGSGRGWVVAGAAAVTSVAGFGSGGGERAVRDTVGPATSSSVVSVTVAPSSGPAPTASSLAEPASVFEGVVVTIGQAMVEPYSWWWVIDLDAGVVIEGSPRVLVEVAQDEVGCGDDFHPMFAHRIGEGAVVSFELVAGEPGPRPEFWMTEGGESFEVEPAVRGRRLRVACPDGTDAAAAELAAQRAIWEMRGPDSYEYSMTWHLFNNFYGDYRIGVVDSEAVSIVKDGVTRFNPAHVEGELPRTIDELFDELERQVSGDRFVAIYDPELGFPVSVEVDEMLNAVDDELEVRVSDLVAGEPAPVVDQPPQVGQRIEATTIYWTDASPDGVSLWLVVDTTGGVTVNGSSRLSLQVPVAEVRCGSELRPLDTLESLEGPATVSFEVTALAGEPRPDAEPEEPDWPTVSGRELHLPTCPPTTEDQLVELDAARARWEAAGIDDYEVDVLWSHSGPESRYLITVVDGETTSIVTLGDNGQPVASEQNSAVLDALPGTVEEFFDWLAAELATQDLTVIYDQADGHPHGVFGATTLIDIMLRRTGG